MKFWLMKSEPSEFSIEDLQKVTQEPWSGVRNYQARNFMRDCMSIGDRIFFYHSSCATPGIVGIATVASSPYPDMTAMDPTSRYYDAKASTADPRWYLVDIRFIEQFPAIIPLKALKANPVLADMLLLSRSRLSIQPVTDAQWQAVLAMGQA